MARIRTIKPEFWTDERLTECSLSARLLFIGTWNFADDNGNLDRSPKQIKARVFPLDSIECEPLLQELITQGLLIEYSVSDKTFLHIQGFNKHQLINRPSKPTCPAFNGSVSPHTPLMTEGKGREGNVKEKAFGDKSPEKQSTSKNKTPWRYNDVEIVKRAQALKISTGGKDRFQLLQEIDNHGK